MPRRCPTDAPQEVTMIIRITETAIGSAVKRAAADGKRIELADAGHAGLRLRNTPTGHKAWVLGMRDSLGEPRRFPLGSHPTMGLAEAREAARAKRVEVKAGGDPISEGRKKRAIGRDAKENIGTLGALIELYEKKEGGRLKSWPEIKRRLDSVFAKLMKKPVSLMKVGDIQFEADNWPSAASASAAIRYIRPIMKWASQRGRGYVSRELIDLVPPAPVGKRDRILNREELARILPVMKASDRNHTRAMHLMLLTACRREEAGAARWRDVSFERAEWLIPSTKNGKPHVVPLSRQAVELLSGTRPQNAKPDDLVFRARGGGRLANWGKAATAIQKVSKTSGWTRHDLRRTAATLMGELGEPPHVIEAALNHAAIHSSLASLYNKSKYRPEVAAALQRLADHLDGIVAGGATITQLRATVAA